MFWYYIVKLSQILPGISANYPTVPVRKGPTQALTASHTWPAGRMGIALAVGTLSDLAGPITFYH